MIATLSLPSPSVPRRHTSRPQRRLSATPFAIDVTSTTMFPLVVRRAPLL
ncbi:hypothetical protein E2C01_081890 [Portunus trituberculatus]|uniref:Uncharacterized protein n=1 Tax=Portunus trituberculatus TaxID=210409 RepID=A0A5B7IT22_PORTR|nr:hypothetical protein [Portunus trituberculatus]